MKELTVPAKDEKDAIWMAELFMQGRRLVAEKVEEWPNGVNVYKVGVLV